MAAGNAVEDNTLAIQPSNQLKKLRKRPRTELDRRSVDANLEVLLRKRPRTELDRRSVDANLEVLRSYTKGVEATVEKLQSAMAEREADVTVREVASISAEARLAQKSAYLEAYEARLQDWDARMRSKATALQRWQAGLQDQQERLQQLGFSTREISSPDDTDDEVEPMQLPWQHQAYKGGLDASWQEDVSDMNDTWKQDRPYGPHASEVQDRGADHHVPHPLHEKLRVEPLSVGQDGKPRVGLRIVRSSPPPDAAAAIASTSADSPSECSARAAAVFPADEPLPSLTGPSLQHGGEPATTSALADPTKQQNHMASDAAEQTATACQRGPALSRDKTYPKQHVQQDSIARHSEAAADQGGSPPQQQKTQMGEQEMLEQLANAAVTAGDISLPPIQHTLGIPPKLAWKHASEHQSIFHSGAPVGSSCPSTPTFKFGDHNPFASPMIHTEPSIEGTASPVFSKALDYKSCDHIMCLTKDMARHLFPPAPLGNGGGPTQMTVDLEDDSGRLWPMTYRCVPHRYSYELRAGWKAFAAFWNVGVGDTVLLWRSANGSLRISLRTASSVAATCPAAATRHAAHQGRLIVA